LVLKLGEQGVDVERIVGCRQAAVGGTGPRFRRAIPVQLDSIAVGIVEIQRLDEPVVVDPAQVDAVLLQAAQRTCQRGSRRVAKGDVIQPGGARGGRATAQTLERIQPEVMVVLIVGGEKRSPTGRRAKAPRSLLVRNGKGGRGRRVEGDRPIEV
jgi:hypothetical protein